MILKEQIERETKPKIYTSLMLCIMLILDGQHWQEALKQLLLRIQGPIRCEELVDPCNAYFLVTASDNLANGADVHVFKVAEYPVRFQQFEVRVGD